MDIDEFLKKWNNAEIPVCIILKNDAVFFADISYGNDSLTLYLNNKKIGYCNLKDIKEVY